VGPGAGQDGCGKSRPHRDLECRTVQSIASSYTNYAIPAHILLYLFASKLKARHFGTICNWIASK
jgi:hypothetical protein